METELTQQLQQRRSGEQSIDSPAEDSPVGLAGPVLDGDFRTAPIPSEPWPVRKSVESDPFDKPFKISRVYEVNPVGGSGAQYVAVAGEGNGRWSDQLDFQAHTIIIDNWSNQLVYCPSARKFIPPWQVGVVINMPTGTATLDIRFIGVAGIAAPAVQANQFVSLQAYEGILPPSPGTSLAGTVTGVDTKVNIDQVAGVAATQSGGDLNVNLDRLSGAAVNNFSGDLGVALDRVGGVAAPANIGDFSGAVSVGIAGSVAASAAGTAANAVITFGAVAGQKHRVNSLIADYTVVAANANTTLVVSDGTTTLTFHPPVAVSTPFTAPIPESGWLFATNTAVTITLLAGPATCVGQVNASKHTA